jgi:Ankyrin repeats (3 copies)
VSSKSFFLSICGETMSNTDDAIIQIEHSNSDKLATAAQSDKIQTHHPEQLQGTALMRSIAMGTAAEVRQELSAKSNLSVRDTQNRTPWLLSIYTGDIEKTEILWTAAIDPTDRGYGGQTAVMLAIESGNLAMLQWLMAKGFEITEVDDSDETALRFAIQQDAVEFVALLLKAGADPQQQPAMGWRSIYLAKSIAVARMLVAAGEDLNGISRSVRQLLTNVSTDVDKVSPEQYKLGKRQRFGLSNPELMSVDFWRSMVGSRWSAREARIMFDESEAFDEPIWSFDRCGQSLTELPDGRIIEIGGGHEDSYDPDFCIYNDVVVHDGQGNFQIFGYPRAVFPPTDFHTATLVGDYIYIIGGLGYYQCRTYHQTPVYRLDCRSYQIEPVLIANSPGWIYEHRAQYLESGVIMITGGTIEDAKESKKNCLEYRLNIANLTCNH